MIRPRPTDLPDLRDEAVQGIGSEQFLELEELNGNRHPVFKSVSPRELGRIKAHALSRCDLYFASAEMTDLAAAASNSLPKFDVLREDVPCKEGLLVFGGAAPHIRYGDEELIYPVAAVGWWELGADGVLFHPFTWRDEFLDAALKSNLITQAEYEFNIVKLPRFTPIGDMAIWCPYGRDVPWPDAYEPDNPTSDMLVTLKLVKAAWLLMAQSITSISDARYDRAAIRRLAKQGKEPPRVRVITLRRPSNPAGSGQSDREYHHQWIVRGHWRQQWYATREVHRPVWIAPHVKGPEGAPMLGGEKVYAWTR